MLGYSLGNDAFSPAKMRGMIEWIDQRFERCAILVGDSIYRISLQIDRGMAEEEALREAIRIGSDRADEVRSLVADAARCRFTVLACSDLARHAYYAESYRLLEALHDQDAAYASAVRDFSAMFLRRRNALDGAQLALSRRYLSEELAIMACMVRDGHETFVYPGNLAIAAELSNGLHPGAPPELRAMTTVSLDMRPRASKSNLIAQEA